MTDANMMVCSGYTTSSLDFQEEVEIEMEHMVMGTDNAPSEISMTISAIYGATAFDMHCHMEGESKWMFINGADSITIYEATVDDDGIVTALRVIPFDEEQIVTGE